MKNVVGLLILLLPFTNTFSQTGKLNKDSVFIVNEPQFLIKVKGSKKHKWGRLDLRASDEKQIVGFEILKEKKDPYYHRESVNGWVLVTFKRGSEILTTNELLQKTNINKSDYNLPIFIDSMLVLKNSYVGVKHRQIKSATVSVEPETAMRYINIITNIFRYKSKPKE